MLQYPDLLPTLKLHDFTLKSTQSISQVEIHGNIVGLRLFFVVVVVCFFSVHVEFIKFQSISSVARNALQVNYHIR